MAQLHIGSYINERWIVWTLDTIAWIVWTLDMDMTWNGYELKLDSRDPTQVA